eukprot:UN09787
MLFMVFMILIRGLLFRNVKIPKEYPLKPPQITMITPNGRFECNKALCLSISSYHPELWNPTWTVETILVGIYSFMIESTPTTGSIETTSSAKRLYAKKSLEYNKKNETFQNLFEDLCKEERKIVIGGNNNNQDDTGIQCRYCRQPDEEKNLIAPCKCKP